MKIKVTAGSSKSIEQWSSRDFIMYYFNKLYFLTKKDFVIPPVAWQGFAGRMKGFRNKLNISNVQYKKFIDSVFERFFSENSYVPCFGAIVSERVYFIVNTLCTQRLTDTDFEKLRRELYSNNILFSEVDKFKFN